MRYIWKANQVVFWVKADEAFEEKNLTFLRELENNLDIYFFLILHCCPLVYPVDIL